MQFTKAEIEGLTVPVGKSELIEWDPSLPGFGCRVRQGGSRTWIVQYRVGSQRRRESLGDVRKVDLAAARKIAKHRFASVELGLDPRADKDKPAITLRKAVDLYLDIKHATLRPATYKQAKYHFDKLWKPLADRRLEQITRADVAARLQEIVKAHGRTQAARARGNLSTLMTWAAKEGLGIETNPVAFTNNPAEGILARERVLDDDEIAAIWSACRDDDFGRIVKLLLVTGCRREKIGQLQWSEVNLDTGVMIIPGERTKNHRVLELILPPLALGILRSARPGEGRAYVFGRRGDRGFAGWAWGKLALDNSITNARGKTLAHWTLHDARRTMRTGLGRLGVAPHVAELAINHVKGGIESVYDRHKYRCEIATALALWADHVIALIEGRPPKVVSIGRATS